MVGDFHSAEFHPHEASPPFFPSQEAKEQKKLIFKFREKAEKVLGIYSTSVGFTRAITKAVESGSRVHHVIAQVFIPFRSIALLAAPFEFVNIGMSVKETVQAPGALKALPLLKVSNAVGGILDHFAASISISETAGASGIQGLVAATGPIVVAAAVLQVAGIAITAWNLHELGKQWDDVMARLGKKDNPDHEPTSEEYKAALEYLNAKPMSRKEKFKQTFFGFLTKGQKEKIEKIFKEKNSEPVLKSTFDALKKHVFHKRVQHALTIAILIIGIIGVLLLVFSPTPIAPFAWALLATTGIASLGVLAYSAACNRDLNRSLLKLLEKR